MFLAAAATAAAAATQNLNYEQMYQRTEEQDDE